MKWTKEIQERQDDYIKIESLRGKTSERGNARQLGEGNWERVVANI